MNTTTAISICSRALLLFGADTISSFIEASTEAKVSSNFYETTLRFFLSSYRWRFATKKATLSKLTQKPHNEYAYQYQLPTDFITCIKTYPQSEYEIYGDKIFHNSASLDIDYIYRVDETYFTPWFQEALEYLLASKFAIPVTGEENKAGALYQIFLDKFKKARHIDSSERTATPIQHSPFVEARFNNGY